MAAEQADTSILKELVNELKSLKTEITFLRDTMKMNALQTKNLTEKIEKVKG